jgi:hypothetical protein
MYSHIEGMRKGRLLCELDPVIKEIKFRIQKCYYSYS